VTHHKSEKITTADKVSAFISKNKIILWGALVFLVIITVVFAIVDKKIKDAAIMYSDKSLEIQQNFQDWNLALEEDKDTAETLLLKNVNAVIESGEKSILLEKAFFFRGQLYLQKEEWEMAVSDFSQIAEISPDSYIASVALYNAASAKENNGDIPAAIALLEKLKTEYKDTSPIIPETVFNIGRLNESLNNIEASIAAYEELASSYSSSNWTNLAKTRIILLKASGASQ
jgi:tetratricopeptide (TPR) repeat protein